VRIRPLTILIGPNSSGKSSFIAPLLLFKQSLLSRTGGNALLTRGEYVDAGAYAEFVGHHDLAKSVGLGVRWRSERPRPDIEPVGSYEPGGAEFSFQQGARPEAVALHSYRAQDLYRRTLLQRRRRADGSYTLKLATPRRSRRARSQEDATELRAERRINNAMRQAVGGSRPVDFLFRSEPVRRAGVEASLETAAPRFPFNGGSPGAALLPDD
jgi:hypothetical protein